VCKTLPLGFFLNLVGLGQLTRSLPGFFVTVGRFAALLLVMARPGRNDGKNKYNTTNVHANKQQTNKS
jgi:hypothetical protein